MRALDKIRTGIWGTSIEEHEKTNALSDLKYKKSKMKKYKKKKKTSRIKVKRKATRKRKKMNKRAKEKYLLCCGRICSVTVVGRGRGHGIDIPTAASMAAAHHKKFPSLS